MRCRCKIGTVTSNGATVDGFGDCSDLVKSSQHAQCSQWVRNGIAPAQSQSDKDGKGYRTAAGNRSMPAVLAQTPLHCHAPGVVVKMTPTPGVASDE